MYFSQFPFINETVQAFPGKSYEYGYNSGYLPVNPVKPGDVFVVCSWIVVRQRIVKRKEIAVLNSLPDCSTVKDNWTVRKNRMRNCPEYQIL